MVLIFRTLIVGFILLCSASLNASEKVVVEIVYEEGKPARVVEVPFHDGLTALEALQHAAIVETKPVGEYVFVSSIDGVRAHRDIGGWLYQVDGVSPQKLAISYKLLGPSHTKWIYMKVTCGTDQDENEEASCGGDSSCKN